MNYIKIRVTTARFYNFDDSSQRDWIELWNTSVDDLKGDFVFLKSGLQRHLGGRITELHLIRPRTPAQK